MSTLTTGLAGQQQLRSARRGGPDQAARSSAALPAALALRCGNLILVPPASGRGASSHRALPGCSSSLAPAAEVAATRAYDGRPAVDIPHPAGWLLNFLRSGVPTGVQYVCRDARRDRVGPADSLKRG